MSLLAEVRTRHPRLISAAGRLFLVGMAVILLYTTIRKTGSDILGDLRQAVFPLLVATVILYGLIQLLGGLRWKLLLNVQGIRLSLFDAFKLTLIGGFFGLLIPGAVSGDILKIAYTGRNFPGRIPAITLTIVLDRILGLSGLFLIAFLVTALNLGTLLPLLQEHPQLMWALLAVNLGFAGSVVLYLIYRGRPLLQRLFHLQDSNVLQSLLPRMIYAPLAKFFQGLDLYQGRQRVLFLHLGISALIHFCCGCCFWLLGKALHEIGMGFQQYQITTQISNATGILPVTPGGIGLRDFTAATFFKIFEASPADVSGSIALSYSLTVVLWALAGALLLCFSPNLRQYAKS